MGNQSTPVQQSHSKVRRPRIVSFVGWLIFLQGIGFMGSCALRIIVARWGDLQIPYLSTYSNHSPAYLYVVGGIWGGLSILALFSGFSLWNMRPNAWILAMLIQMLALVSALVGYLRGSPNYLAMLLGVVIVLTLNNQEVQNAFRR